MFTVTDDLNSQSSAMRDDLLLCHEQPEFMVNDYMFSQSWMFSVEAGLTAPIHIRPRSTFAPDPPQLNWMHRPFQIRPTQIGLTAPIRDSPHYRLDAPPPSRSAPHKLDLQPQYGIPPAPPQPTFAPIHIRPHPSYSS